MRDTTNDRLGRGVPPLDSGHHLASPPAAARSVMTYGPGSGCVRCSRTGTTREPVLRASPSPRAAAPPWIRCAFGSHRHRRGRRRDSTCLRLPEGPRNASIVLEPLLWGCQKFRVWAASVVLVRSGGMSGTVAARGGPPRAGRPRFPPSGGTERFPRAVHGRGAPDSPKRRWAGGGNRGAGHDSSTTNRSPKRIASSGRT